MIPRFAGTFLVLLCGISLLAYEPPKYPDWPLPPIPDKKPDLPKPTFDPIDKLPKGKLYVVLHNGDQAQLLVSPSGMASVKEYKDSVVIDGDFIDGGEETREYKAKQVFLVKRLQPGSFELLKVPAGKVERRQLDDVVPGPMPPGPSPPGPQPPGPAPVPAKTFRVIFAVESGDTLTAAQAGVIYGKDVEAWLTKNCTGGKDGFRRRDRNTTDVSGKEMNEIWQAARQAITATPCVAVEKNGHIEIIALESTPEKMIAVFEEYLQGKRGK